MTFSSSEFLPWLKETFSSFAGIAVAVFLVCVLWGAFQGWRRSIFRQGIHVVITLIIAVIAFSITTNTCDSIFASFNDMSVADFIASLEAEFEASGDETPQALVDFLETFSMDTIGYVVAIVFNTLLAPLVFTVLFVLITIAGKIVTGIVCFFVPKGKTLTFRLLGIAGGVIEGALIAGVVLLPLVGWVNIAGNAVQTVKEEADLENDPTASAIVEFYDDTVTPLEDHVIFKMVGSLGGNDALTKLATIENDGEDKDLRDEFGAVTKLGVSAMKLSETDFKALTEQDKAAINSLIDGTSDSVILSKIVCSAMNGVANGIQKGSIEFWLDDPYGEAVDEIVDMLKTMTTDTMKDDLTTLTNLYYLLSDEGVLAVFEDKGDGTVEASTDDLNKALTKTDENGKTVINRAIDILDENPRTQGLVKVLGKISVTILYQEMGISKDGEAVAEAYEAVSDGVKEILTIDTTGKEKEEVASEVSAKLTETLNSIDITVGETSAADITQETIDKMADYVAGELIDGSISLDDAENVSDADVLNVLLSYYSSLNSSEE